MGVGCRGCFGMGPAGGWDTGGCVRGGGVGCGFGGVSPRGVAPWVARGPPKASLAASIQYFY